VFIVDASEARMKNKPAKGKFRAFRAMLLMISPAKHTRMRETITNCSLGAIEMSEDGAFVRLVLTDTVTPHNVTHIECEDVVVFHLHRCPGDELPYFVGDAVWTHLSEAETANKLDDIPYPFLLGDTGKSLQPRRLFHLQLDGGIVGDMLCCGLKVARAGRALP
jgi:hypothetical protein